MFHFRSLHLGLVLLLLAAACEPSASSDSAIRTDSAGVSLVEYPQLPPLEASRIAIAAEPDLVLGDGGAFAGSDHEFFEINSVSQLRDGTLVVANHGSRELRFYGADGHFLRSTGREGDGPGEFRQLWRHWTIAGDTVVVLDRAVGRFQHFSPEGTFVRATSIDTAPFAGFSGLPPDPQTVLENGRVVMFLAPPWRATDGVPERQPLLVALHGPEEAGWDSVRVLPGEEQVIGVTGDGRLMGSTYIFKAFAVAAGAGATIAVADNARFRIELFDPDGRLVSVLSAPVLEVPVTPDVIEAQIQHMVDWVPFATDDGYPEMLRRAYSSHAPLLPAIRAIFVDGDERIWVERYDVPGSGPSRWEVFERDGTWVGRVEMPEGFVRGMSDSRTAPGFSVSSGRLAGVWRDPDTGVETVRVYRLVDPAS